MASMSPGMKTMFRAMSLIAIPVFINFPSVCLIIITFITLKYRTHTHSTNKTLSLFTQIKSTGLDDLYNHKRNSHPTSNSSISNTICSKLLWASAAREIKQDCNGTKHWSLKDKTNVPS